MGKDGDEQRGTTKRGATAKAEGAIPEASLSLRESALYMGGMFSSVGGQPRNALAAVDTAGGAVLPWNPDCDGLVEALALSDSTVYAGGMFGNVGGQPRQCLAAITRTGGEVLPWNPSPNCTTEQTEVKALACLDGTVYAGGFFNTIGGKARNSLAALDGLTGVPTDWTVDGDGAVWAFDAGRAVLSVGGRFTHLGLDPHGGIATLSLPASDRGVNRPPGVVLGRCWPNPARESTTLDYVLTSAASVSLSLYDLQGRRVLQLFPRTLKAAGQYSATVPTARLRAGCYLCRLEAGSTSAARKVVVLR